MSADSCTSAILDNAACDGVRLTPEEAAALLCRADFLALGEAAGKKALSLHPSGRATFQIDRNINYTNICVSKCRFCAFYRTPGAKDGYVLSPEQVAGKVADAVRRGATQVMMQGGLNPDLDLVYYENILRAARGADSVTVHSLSPPEIFFIAQRSGLSIRAVLKRLRAAGLDSLPGGGAEILVDRVRQRLSPGKVSADQWLEVMETAHQLGMKTTATMMIGSIETPRERIEHLCRIRDLQDRTGGFTAFIPWTFKPGNTGINVREISSFDYLRTLAMSRLFLDNIPNIQGSWVTQGKEIGQMSLHFGANDLGSIMLEENVVRAAGAHNRITEQEMVSLISRAGKIPAQRSTQYTIIKTYDTNYG